MELLKVEDLAEMLDYEKVTIRRMIRRGDLEGKKLGRRWYVPEENLKEYFSDTDQETEELKQNI